VRGTADTKQKKKIQVATDAQVQFGMECEKQKLGSLYDYSSEFVVTRGASPPKKPSMGKSNTLIT